MKQISNLADRTAPVCGAGASGIGLAAALQLADAGADIVAVDLKEELVAETLGEVRARGRKVRGELVPTYVNLIRLQPSFRVYALMSDHWTSSPILPAERREASG